MLNIRGMSIVENLLTGVNGFGQGLTLASAASGASPLHAGLRPRCGVFGGTVSRR